MPRKILLTGGTGFVGSRLIPILKQRGFDVVILSTRNMNAYKECPVYIWNPKKGEVDLNAFEGVTDIVNLAGATLANRWTPKYKQQILDSRTESQITIAKALEKNNIQINTYISASGISIYPNSDESMKESSKEGTTFLANVVHHWERCSDMLEPFSQRVIKFRIGYVLDKSEGGLVPLIKLTKFGLASGQGNGKQWMSWVSIHDLTKAFVFALENSSINGVYNVVSPNSETNKSFNKKLAKSLKRPFILPNVPSFILKLVLGEMSALLLSNNKVSSKKLEEEGFEFSHSNLETTFNQILK